MYKTLLLDTKIFVGFEIFMTINKMMKQRKTRECHLHKNYTTNHNFLPQNTVFTIKHGHQKEDTSTPEIIFKKIQ